MIYPDLHALAYEDGYRKGIKHTLVRLVQDFDRSLPDAVFEWVERIEKELE